MEFLLEYLRGENLILVAFVVVLLLLFWFSMRKPSPAAGNQGSAAIEPRPVAAKKLPASRKRKRKR